MSAVLHPLPSLQRKLFVVGALMLASALLAWWAKPTHFWSEHLASTKYATQFPASFGTWDRVPNAATSVVNPQQQETLDAIYDELVTELYRDRTTGRMLMISLAYGNNQSRATQVHKPEVCYPAQGFELLSMEKGTLDLASAGKLPVMRIVARQGQRVEPLTYWIRAGDRVVRGAVEQNLARISLGLRGYIPDGLLFRVSEVSGDAASSFQLQERFVREYLQQLTPQAIESFIGTRAASGP